MCDHLEILDNGEYICVKCGVVIRQEYLCSNGYVKPVNTIDKNSEVYLNICNILEKLHFSNVSYSDQVYKNINKYLSNYKHRSELKIGAGIFYVLSLNDIPYQISKIARLVCLNNKEYKILYKLIQVFPQSKLLQNDVFNLINLTLSNYEKKDIDCISKRVKSLKCEYCSYSPITQIAGISYLYFKKYKKEKISLKSLCESLLISQNSVYLYLKHSCVKNFLM